MNKLRKLFGRRNMSIDKISTPSTHIQLMSDLHLEVPKSFPMYTQFDIEPKAPILALLGDIGCVTDDRLFDFLEKQLHHFETVMFLFGNHEPYAEDKWTWDAAVRAMEAFERETNMARQQVTTQDDESVGQFIFLNRTRFDLDDTTTVLGCTLFSHVRQDQQSTISMLVSDFHNIAEWTTEKHNAAHEEDLQWLNQQVEEIARQEPVRRIIVLTHHSPTLHPTANDPAHLQDARNVGSAFVTDLSDQRCWTSKNVKVWAFGHTHFNCDFELGGKRIVANQKGYSRSGAFDFDVDKVVSF